jgi:tetratricopeptide (TPR) repeat protein
LLVNKKSIFIVFYIIIFLLINTNLLYADEIEWQEIKNISQQNVKNNPDDIMENFRFAIAMANLGEINESYHNFEELREKFSIDEFNRSVKIYLELLKNDEDNLLLLNYAAFYSVINNNYKEGEFYFEKIKSIDPENVWIQNYLATIYLELEKYDRAEKLLHNANKIYDNEYSHFLLAILYYKQGRILKALAEFTQSGEAIKTFLF